MNPEIKAAIERESKNTDWSYFSGVNIYCEGAKYGYKLGLLVGKMEIYSVNDWTSKLYNAQKELQELLGE